MRRGSVGVGRRGGGFRGIGAGCGPFLDLSNLSLGTFTRSTEGSYLTGAPTDGSSAFLAWAGVNVRRIENRGDGLGAMLLMEGSRTNYALRSRALENAVWLLAGTVTRTADDANGPDAVAEATRMQASLASDIHQSAVTGGVKTVVSAYGRAKTGTSAWQISLWDGAVITAVGNAAQSTTYARMSVVSPGTPASTQIQVVDTADRTGQGGISAATEDVEVDLAQIEAGYFPSSPIRTTAAAVTRGADVLSYAVGAYPASFLTTGLRFTIAPDASSAELVSSATQFAPIWFGTGPATGVFIGRNGGVCKVSVWDNNVQKAVSGTVTFSRGQLLTISINPATGVLVVSGCSSGDGSFSGTAFAWGTTGTGLWVGARFNGVDPMFGRMGTSLVAL